MLLGDVSQIVLVMDGGEGVQEIRLFLVEEILVGLEHRLQRGLVAQMVGILFLQLFGHLGPRRAAIVAQEIENPRGDLSRFQIVRGTGEEFSRREQCRVNIINQQELLLDD